MNLTDNEIDLRRSRSEIQALQAAMARAFPFGIDWQPWTPTPTGWSGTPTLDCRRLVIGKGVWFRVYASGTSNLTTATLTLPFPALDSPGWGGVINYAVDNGTRLSTSSLWRIDYAAPGVISFYSTFVGGAWTATGTKTLMANGFYQIP